MILVLGQVLPQQPSLTLVVLTVYYALASAAIVIGGGWAYLKYIRYRSLKERLSLTVEGFVEGTQIQSGLRVIVNPEVENLGLREFRLPADIPAVLRVYARTLQGDASRAQLANWERIRAWTIFVDRDRLEPGEPVHQPQLIELAGDGYGTIMVELEVFSRSGRSWRAAQVVSTDVAGAGQGRDNGS